MSISHSIKQITTAFERYANQNLDKYGLTMSQMETLMFLYSCEQNKASVIQRDIENAMRLKNPTVSGILDRLERKGFISRVPNPSNRRVNQIVLTPKAISLRETATADLEALEENMLQEVSAEDREHLAQTLNRILDSLANK